LFNSRLAPRIVGGIPTVAVLAWAATFVPAFDSAIGAFTERWNGANEVEGGVGGVLMDRFLGGLWTALANAGDIPILGLGLGLGTNAGAKLLTGERFFLVSEGEWARIIGEMGPILGLALIAVRVALAITIIYAGIRSWRHSNPVPLILASVAALWVAQGNWAQPTSLGFSVMAAGLALAATRLPLRPPERIRQPVLDQPMHKSASIIA
jgi:hypothetical protein